MHVQTLSRLAKDGISSLYSQHDVFNLSLGCKETTSSVPAMPANLDDNIEQANKMITTDKLLMLPKLFPGQ